MNRIAPASLLTITLLALGWQAPAVFRAAAPSATAARAPAPRWQNASPKLTLNYSGCTTRYSCDGIENKVRESSWHKLRRPQGPQGEGNGLQRGASRPSRFAWVRAEFSTLAPATDPGAAAAVSRPWTKVQIAPHRLISWRGECELVEQMKDMLQKGFALRNAEFRTSCVPYQVSMADYSLTAEVLKTAAP